MKCTGWWSLRYEITFMRAINIVRAHTPEMLYKLLYPIQLQHSILLWYLLTVYQSTDANIYIFKISYNFCTLCTANIYKKLLYFQCLLWLWNWLPRMDLSLSIIPLKESDISWCGIIKLNNLLTQHSHFLCLWLLYNSVKAFNVHGDSITIYL